MTFSTTMAYLLIDMIIGISYALIAMYTGKHLNKKLSKNDTHMKKLNSIAMWMWPLYWPFYGLICYIHRKKRK